VRPELPDEWDASTPHCHNEEAVLPPPHKRELSRAT
jgi:hypothetical protein